jgi:glycosyltransferase involved in cell wall biosynthesis
LEPTTLTEPSDDPSRQIAVAIPCYNEAAAIATVISQWRAALPDAEIVIFDNNSTDGTGAIARGLGVRVVDVPDQGKGFAVRAMFATLQDREAVIMVDGDGTYPPEEIGRLLAPILDGTADMTIGARIPVAAAGSMTPLRGLGNLLIRGAFRVLIGRGPGDLLSGYRVFSRRFRESVRLRSEGFEIETELASEAVARRMRTVEFPVPYHPRIVGTASKLKAFRDGWRILKTIVRQSLRLRPWRPLLIVLVLVILAASIIGALVGWARPTMEAASIKHVSRWVVSTPCDGDVDPSTLARMVDCCCNES